MNSIPIIGGNIPIIGQVERTWFYAFHKSFVPAITDFPSMQQHLLYAIMPPLPDGKIEIMYVSGLAQSAETIERIKQKHVMVCNKEDLITPDELGMNFIVETGATVDVDTPLDSAVDNAENP